MARSEPTARELPIHPEVGYEHTDINPRGVVITGASILVGAWICIALLYFYFGYLIHERAVAGPAPPLRAQGVQLLPPEPRIQTSPRTDLRDLRAYEDSQLHNYRWIDKQKGIVGIPIDRAMGIVVSRGIPPQHAPASLGLYPPQAGTRETGFEGKVEPEPR